MRHETPWPVRTGLAALAAGEDGAAILEFAIVLPLLLALLGGAFEIGRALLLRQAMIDAVAGGARMLARVPDPSCSPSCSPPAAVIRADTADAIAAGGRVPPDSVRMSSTYDPTAGTVTMEASVSFDGPLLGLVGLKPLMTLTARHEERRRVE